MKLRLGFMLIFAAISLSHPLGDWTYAFTRSLLHMVGMP